MIEIDAIIQRCRDCSSATAVAVRFQDLDEQGRPVFGVRTERLEHSRADCAKFQALERETWPVLF